MKNVFKNFGIKENKSIPVDEFIDKALYNPKFGFYSKKIPFGRKGDFVTAPTISNLFSEIIAIWVVSTWEKFGKPEKFNFVELGPGDGSLSKVLVNIFKQFPEFNSSLNMFLYEKSKLLSKIQKNKIKNSKVKWIKNFNKIKKGPVIFFGNEFFDAIPIKQFLKKDNLLLEKYYTTNARGLSETYKLASKIDVMKIRSFVTLKNKNFIEFPKLGFLELIKITKKISIQNGGILLIDYGYLNSHYKNTLQAIKRNKKINISNMFNYLGDVDITSLVNFSLLKEFFLKNNLKVSKIVSQKFFLERMGIIERFKILEKNMTLKQKNYITNTLNRLLNKKHMGELFKVIFAYKSKSNNFFGFN